MPSYEASIRNFLKAVASPRWQRPRPWRSKEESEMVRRFAFWWFTCRDPRRPSGRDWARQLGISHTWLQKLIREFEADPDKARELQAAYGDPTLEELNEARACSEEMRRQGELRYRRRRKRVDSDEY
jgi:hypothetical protein